MTISAFLFVVSALFLIACYFFRHVARGIDSDDDVENAEGETPPADSIAQTERPVEGVIMLSPGQLDALVESRVRSLLKAHQPKVQVPSVKFGDTGTHTDETKTEAQKTHNAPKFSSHGSGAVISHVSFKAPQPLFSQIPEVWFEILEQQFKVAGITKECTMYSHAVGALDARLHNQFASLITRDKGSQPYSTFKQEVIKGLGESEKTKLNNLLHGLTLGDRKPSQLLELFRRNAGTRFADDSVRQLWLQRLPQQIQLVLTPFENDIPLSVLAERADNLVETMSHAQIHSVATSTSVPLATSQPNSPDLNVVLAQVATVLGEVSALLASNRSRSPNRSHSNRSRNYSNSRDNSRGRDECFYHRRFGERALKCVSGCKHNATFVPNQNIQTNPKK